MRKIAILALLLIWPQIAFAIFWPVKPTNQAHPLGNYWGEYQDYGGSPYLHPGIDIFGNAGDSVFAVRPGYVKAILTTSGEWHWRVATGSSAGADSCNGWLYAHLLQSSIAVQIGQYVQEGQYLGKLVEWPIYNFHHLHFACIRNAGVTWQATWLFVGNPYDSLTVFNDTAAPVIRKAYGNYLYAISNQNNPSQYFNPAGALSGKIDLISRIDDLVGDPYWRLNPHRIEYNIRNTMLDYGPVLSFEFSDFLPWEDVMDVIYRVDATCPTRGDYDYRDYYFIITNSDGDGKLELSDAANSLVTDDFPDGYYWAVVRATDGVGNSSVDSMQIQIDNNPISLFSIYMVPNDIPTSVPAAGGTFRFTGIIANNYGNTTQTDVWIMLTLPNGTTYGPLYNFQNIPLTGYQVLAQSNIVQNVPSYAPPGDYKYRAYAGDYPSVVRDSAVFAFTKSAMAIDAEEASFVDWELNGWFGGEEESPELVGTSDYSTVLPNYPNPFNGSTVIPYRNVNGESQLRIYDISGRLVYSIAVNGSGELIWEGINGNGDAVPTGIYFYRIIGDSESKANRMILVK